MWVALFNLNLGSTTPLGQSMFYLSLLWWWGAHSSSSPISVSPQLIWGVHSRSGSSSRSYLCFTFWPEFRGGGPLQLQSNLSPTWAYCGGVNSRKIWSQLHFFLYRNISAAHNWIGSLPSDGQWAIKGSWQLIWLICGKANVDSWAGTREKCAFGTLLSACNNVNNSLALICEGRCSLLVLIATATLRLW